MQQLEGALGRCRVLVWVQVGEQLGRLLVNLRVVFHGAAAQGVDVAVDAELAVGQLGEVPDEVELRHFGQSRRVVTQVLRAQQPGQVGALAPGGCRRLAAGSGSFEDQREIAAAVVSHRRPPGRRQPHRGR